jgi:hypothetical protein
MKFLFIFSLLMTTIGFAEETVEVAKEAAVVKKLVLEEAQGENETEISQEETVSEES